MPPNSTSSTRFRPAILIPTFNNAATLGGILQSLESLDLPVIVVNDGSTDSTSAVLERFAYVKVLTHPRNQGKAAALRTGFAEAERTGCTHALTIDADGQHDPQQVPMLLDLANQSPTALILGRRDDRIAGYPAINRLGREVSNLLVWLESGLRLSDSQCGLRVYPLELLASFKCAASHYGFETEILTKSAWRGFGVVEVDVHCNYAVESGRVTHFRPMLDSLRAVAMHTRLLACAVPRWPKRLALGFRPVALWRRLRTAPRARNEFAAGLAVGVFFSCVPIYGAQGVASILAARAMRVNRLSALAGSQLSTPPLNALLISISLLAGHVLLHGSWPAIWHAPGSSLRPLSVVRAVLLDWTVGGVLLGAVLGCLTYWVARVTLAAGAKPSDSETA
jgi:uncharacterized protein (DUF2062 family)